MPFQQAHQIWYAFTSATISVDINFQNDGRHLMLGLVHQGAGFCYLTAVGIENIAHAVFHGCTWLPA